MGLLLLSVFLLIQFFKMHVKFWLNNGISYLKIIVEILDKVFLFQRGWLLFFAGMWLCVSWLKVGFQTLWVLIHLTFVPTPRCTFPEFSGNSRVIGIYKECDGLSLGWLVAKWVVGGHKAKETVGMYSCFSIFCYIKKTMPLPVL